MDGPGVANAGEANAGEANEGAVSEGAVSEGAVSAGAGAASEGWVRAVAGLPAGRDQSAARELIWSVMPSPVGELLLTSDADHLTGLFFRPHKASHHQWDRCRRSGLEDPLAPVPAAARRQLEEYFAGARTGFDLPLAPAGTAFQLQVWSALRRIAYGRTESYGQIARRLGLVPGASRAVGLANGANPISIIVPCHRVIGADGSLTGYGGGLERKRFLLDLEQGSLF